jgi:hypothetical protein
MERTLLFILMSHIHDLVLPLTRCTSPLSPATAMVEPSGETDIFSQDATFRDDKPFNNAFITVAIIDDFNIYDDDDDDDVDNHHMMMMLIIII